MYRHWFYEIPLRSLRPYLKDTEKLQRRDKLNRILLKQELMGGRRSADLIALLDALNLALPQSKNFRQAYRLSLLSLIHPIS